MMNKIIFVTFLLSFFSCSRINVASQDHYHQQHIRHGVVPLNTTPGTASLGSKLEQASIQRGKTLYEQHCLGCHGVRGKGDGPLAKDQERKPADLQKLVREVPNFTFFMSISQWQGDMPGWKEPFNDVDRTDLVNYLKSFR